MANIGEITMLAAAVVYVVDVSGFTQAWRGLLARLLHTDEARLRPLPPFDCGTCATWWAVLAWCWITDGVTVGGLFAAAACSLLALPAGELMTFAREGVRWCISRIGGRLL